MRLRPLVATSSTMFLCFSLGAAAMATFHVHQPGVVPRQTVGVARNSDTIYWIKGKALKFGKNSPTTKGRFLAYTRGAQVTLATTCSGVIVTFEGRPRNHDGLTRRFVEVVTESSLPTPQKCDAVATIASSPSEVATLEVVISKNFH